MSEPGLWCNPPPPGTDDRPQDEFVDHEERSFSKSPNSRLVDPFVKSAEYVKYERRRGRSRSRSRHRHRHRSRSRSRSRGRHRHRRRRRRSSASRSRSRSRSRRRHHRRHRSRSRRRSRSKSRRRSSRSKHRERRESPEVGEKATKDQLVEEEEEEEEEEETSQENMFKNDGSFMEMFKKLQEEQMKKSEEVQKAEENKAPPLPVFGKRRGGKVLKTGMVQKNKMTNQEEADAQDAWTMYMKEVKRYKEACCDDDSKTRLLVK